VAQKHKRSTLRRPRVTSRDVCRFHAWALEPLEPRLNFAPVLMGLEADSLDAASATNATSIVYTATFSEPVTGVDPTDFALALTGTVATTLTQVQPSSGAVYKVLVSGISGSGTLGLNLVANGSITDVASNPLVGNFTGQAYTIDQDFPFVQSIDRTSPPGPDSQSSSVSFTVTFSEAVTNVDSADFALAWSGTVWAAPAEVQPVNPSVYRVTVNGITGSGTLGLNLSDNGTIRDLASNPLRPAAALGSFQSGQEFSGGDVPESVSLADVNGDGLLDLVTANLFANTASVLLGNGDGTFQPKQDFATGTFPRSVTVADVNRDGIPDLVTANAGGDSASVLLGNGNGTFQQQQIIATGDSPRSVAVVDVNGDGKADLVTANAGDHSVSVLLGNGNGTFLPRQDFATGSAPYWAAVADVNGDGRPDVVAANVRGNTVSVLLGLGDGTLQPREDFVTGAGPNSVAVGDVNGDGMADLVTANGNAHTASVLLGFGNGSFQPRQDFATGDSPYSVALADVNGDGRPDLVTANLNAASASLLLGAGGGAFQPKQDFVTGTGPISVALADVNGDGRSDLVTANFVASTASVLLGNGGGSFTGQLYNVTVASVVGRYLFYNQSGTDLPLRYDGNNTAINAADDLAIASDKVAYLPGSGAATFDNLSSYAKGINGIMLDLAGTHGTISASDFVFRVGNNNTPDSWAAAPAPTSISVRAGAGVGGSDRIVLTWSNGAITNQWLEVVVLANVNTRLPQKPGYPAGQADRFYFGNAVGDTGAGNTATQANVNATDELGARNNPASLLSNLPITSRFDFNRDGQVNATDVLLARNHPTSIGNVARFLSLAPPPAAPQAGPAADDGAVASALGMPASAGSSTDSADAPRRAERSPNLDQQAGPVARYLEHQAKQRAPDASGIPPDGEPSYLEDASLALLLADLDLA
jgi:hypothetical protein